MASAETRMARRLLIVSTYLAATFILSTESRSLDENVNLLHETLTRNYDKAIIPLETPDKPLEVSHTVMMMNADMSDDTQVLETSYWAMAVWTDYRLKWDPSDYDGLNFTHFPAAEVWVPDVASYNEETKDRYLTHIDDYTDWFVGVSPDGHCHFIIPVTASFTCMSPIFSDWPKDHQLCVQYFSSWSYSSSQMELHMLENFGGNYSEINLPAAVLNGANSKWTVWEKVYVHRYMMPIGGLLSDVENFTLLHYEMDLSRNWDSVYTATLLTPTLVVVALTLINFYYSDMDSFAAKMVSLFNLALTLGICLMNESSVSFGGSEPKIFKLLMANQLMQVVHLILDYLLSVIRRSSMQVTAGVMAILTNDSLQKVFLLSVPYPSHGLTRVGVDTSSNKPNTEEGSTGQSSSSGSSATVDDSEAEEQRRFGRSLLVQLLHRAAFASYAVIYVLLLTILWPRSTLSYHHAAAMLLS